MNGTDLIVIGILAVLFVLALLYLKKKKSCCTNCSSCSKGCTSGSCSKRDGQSVAHFVECYRRDHPKSSEK